MAKLTNVKTLDMENGEITKIQFDGEEYQYISDRAVEGDIGLVVDAWGDQKLGEFFVIKGVEEDSDGDVFYEIDGNTTPFAACFSTRMEVFRKSKSSNQLSGLKKVDGPVVGGSVVFAEDFLDTTAGKAYEIIYVYDDNDFRFTDDVGDGHDNKLYWHSPTFYVKEEEPKLSPKPLFAKVNRPNNEPIVGDFIELDSEAAEYSWLSEDKKYEIIDIDEDGDFIFNDDTGEEEWTETNDIKAIYVKYTQEQAEQDANIGDKILIVNPVTSFSSYSEGDILTVEDVGAFGVRNDIFAEELDEGPYLAAREYIVLTDAQIGDLKGEIKSEEYVPQEGDKVRLLSGGGTWPVVGYENGEIYEVVEKRGHNDSPERIQITKDSGRGSGGGFPLISQVEVIEEGEEEGTPSFNEGDYIIAKESSPYNITVPEAGALKVYEVYGGGNFIDVQLQRDYKNGYDGEVFEVDSKHFRKATQEEIAETLGIAEVSLGDTVEVIADHFFFAEKGETSEVVRLDEDGIYTKDFYIVAFIDGKPRFKVVEKATKKAETAAPAKKYDSPYGEINEGDTVKVVIAEGENPSYGWGDVENGDVGEVISATGERVRARFPSQSFWNAEPSELIKVAENGDLLPGTVVKSKLLDTIYTIAERDPDHDDWEYGSAYKMKDQGEGWLGVDQFEVLTKAETKAQEPTQEKLEVGDLVKVIESPCALPNGTYIIVDETASEGNIYDSEGYIYAPRNVELIAKAASVYA